MTVIPRIHTPLVVANWKMHGLTEATRNILTNIILTHDGDHNVVICPSFTGLRPVGNALESTALKLGAQDCHWQDEGAFTGDISGPMLKNIGVQYVIVGHSERRTHHFEVDEIICKKAAAVHRSEMIAIICVGETEAEYEAGKTLDVLRAQLEICLPESIGLDNTIIAYEPIWAIGTGKTPNLEQMQTVHDFLQDFCREKWPKAERPLYTLYGGSVKAANARDILKISSIDGVLCGSSSTDPDEFRSIVDLACLIGAKK